MTLPKVSIVVCTYNGEKFLEHQLESLISQTYPVLEIIISDDCSTDNTVSIAQRFQERDSRIILYENLQNIGYNKNFEKAFEMATGDFIAISDQDDIWKPNKIANMLSLFAEDTVLVYCQSVRFRKVVPNVDTYSMRRLFVGSDVRKLMYVNNIPGHNIIFKKELLQHAQPFPEGVFYDWWLTIIAATVGTVRATEKVYTFHRLHTKNVTFNKKIRKIQTRTLANERLLTLQNILKIRGLKKEYAVFGKQLLSALQTLQTKSFSPRLFFFLLRYSGIIFFFKKHLWSRLKMAYRLSFAVE